MSAEDLPDLLSVKETAAYIRSPQPTVYYLIKEGKIPAIRIGGRWRVKRRELDEMYGLGSALESSGTSALVVEDDPGMQKFFEQYLSKAGVTHRVVATGTEAIHAVKNGKFDFVFLDLQLPDIGGDEIFRQMKAIRSELSIVITTAYPDSQMLSKILEEAPVTVLKKPFDLNQFEGVVRFLKQHAHATDSGEDQVLAYA